MKMTKDEDILAEKRRLALDLFAQGYNCAQAVAGALAPEYGVDQEDALRLASALGGGLAGTHKEACGTLLGGLMALGAYVQDPSNEGKKLANELGKELVSAFEERNESLCCGALLAQEDIACKSDADLRLGGHPGIRPCARFVVDVVDIVHDITCAQK